MSRRSIAGCAITSTHLEFRTLIGRLLRFVARGGRTYGPTEDEFGGSWVPARVQSFTSTTSIDTLIKPWELGDAIFRAGENAPKDHYPDQLDGWVWAHSRNDPHGHRNKYMGARIVNIFGLESDRVNQVFPEQHPSRRCHAASNSSAL